MQNSTTNRLGGTSGERKTDETEAEKFRRDGQQSKLNF